MGASLYPSAKSILKGQAVGFSVVLGIMWTGEFLNLPQRLFGDAPESMWPRLALRSAVLLGFWLIVHLTTARLLRRLHELEAYLRICSWCRKVNDRGEWLSFEDYFGARFNTETSHGVCPDCARQQLAKHCVAVSSKAESVTKS